MENSMALNSYSIEILALVRLIPIFVVHILTVGAQIPAVGVQIPTVGIQIPMVGAQIPTVGAQIPTVGVQIPAVGIQIPAVRILLLYLFRFQVHYFQHSHTGSNFSNLCSGKTLYNSSLNINYL